MGGKNSREKKLISLIKSNENNIDEVIDLLSYEININYQTEGGSTALFFAVIRDKINVVKLLFNYNLYININNSLSIQTPLLHEHGIQESKINIKIEANPNIINENNKTCLFYSNSEEMTKLLLKNDADPNIKDSRKFNVLEQHLLRYPYSNSYKKIKYLLNNGVNSVNTKLISLPYYLCRCLNSPIDIDIVKMYLDNNVDLNEKVIAGFTPLMYCPLKNYNYDVIKLMLDNGADPNIQNDNGGTVFKSLHFSDIKTIKLLLDYGVNPNLGPVGYTLFLYPNQDNKIKLLLEHGAKFIGSEEIFHYPDRSSMRLDTKRYKKLLLEYGINMEKRQKHVSFSI